YHLYLRGRFLMNKFADLYGSLTGARKCFEEAVELDPMYSAAYAGLSEVCTALGYTTFLPAPEASRAALEAAERAVTLDPSLPEGHTALGWTKTLFAIDMRTAERDFQRALQIAPSDAFGMIMPFIMSRVLICARKFQEADHQMRELLALDPNFDGCYWYLSNALAGQGKLDDATTDQRKGVG